MHVIVTAFSIRAEDTGTPKSQNTWVGDTVLLQFLLFVIFRVFTSKTMAGMATLISPIHAFFHSVDLLLGIWCPTKYYLSLFLGSLAKAMWLAWANGLRVELMCVSLLKRAIWCSSPHLPPCCAGVDDSDITRSSLKAAWFCIRLKFAKKINFDCFESLRFWGCEL